MAFPLAALVQIGLAEPSDLSAGRSPAERLTGVEIRLHMRHLARTMILLASLSLPVDAQQTKWQGTWAASVGTAGTTAFAGTWDAVPGAVQDTANGTWSLRDQNGAELASGTWAAGKEGNVWKGTWQARRASGQIYNGTWRTQVELPTKSQFSEMFEAAITKAVSGTWGMGSYIGAWTIRVYPQK